MEGIHTGILALLKAAITQQPQQLPQDFSLMQAMPLIQKHSLHSLACEGAMLCGVSMTDPAIPALMDGYGKNLLISEEQMLAISQIFDAFDRQGIDYLPLKGCAMKALYPKPELRVMGDADILIRLEQYDAIVPIMEALGFTVLPSQANFIFAKSDRISGGDLYRKLKEHGILVRWFDSDRIRDYVRITIGSAEQMAALVDKIAQLL